MSSKRGIPLNSEAIFGQILKSIRKKQKVSQEELAFRSNLDRTYISMLERGIHQPTLNSLLAIATALGMKAAELVGLVEDELNNLKPNN
jgi:transcriptional regulator with XRE-family HTH domain